MKKRRFPWIVLLLCLAAAVGVFWYTSRPENVEKSTDGGLGLDSALDAAQKWLNQEPDDV